MSEKRVDTDLLALAGYKIRNVLERLEDVDEATAAIFREELESALDAIGEPVEVVDDDGDEVWPEEREERHGPSARFPANATVVSLPAAGVDVRDIDAGGDWTLLDVLKQFLARVRALESVVLPGPSRGAMWPAAKPYPARQRPE
jgi:hypothetical protein